MAIEIAELVAEVTARTTEFKAGMTEVEGGLSKTSKAAGLAGIAIAGGLAYGLGKSIEAAQEGQQSISHMDAAFKAAGINVNDWGSQIEDAESKGRKLGFTNDETRGSLASLTVATHDAGKSLDLLSTAEDYARLKHTSLASASQTLAKAMTGSGRAVKALGIQIIPATDHMDALGAKSDYVSTAQYTAAKAAAALADKNETGAMIIDKVTAATHGQAEAFSSTAAGGMATFHAQVDSIEEGLGNALLPALTNVTSAIAAMAGWMAEHEGVTKLVVIALGALSAALLISAAATWAMNSALLASPITWVVVALIALVAGLVYAYEHFQTFRDIVQSVWAVVEDATGAAINFIIATFNWLKTTATNVWASIHTEVETAWAIIQTVIRVALGIIKTYVMTEFEIIKTTITTAFNVIKDIIKIALDLIHGDWSGAWNAMKNLVSTVISGVEGVLRAAISGFGSIAAQLGGALLSGVKGKADELLSFMKSIPAKIVAALGDLSSLLVNAGEQVVSGLISGIEHSATGAVSGAMGKVKSLLHLTDGTPAGDAEDRSLLYSAGQLAIDGLVDGITSKLGNVAGALADVKSAVAIQPPIGAPAAAGAGTTIQVNNPTFLSGNRTELRQFATTLQEFLA